MSYLSHRSFAIPALENDIFHVRYFLLPTGSPAQPARKHAGKIAPVLSSKFRTPARTAASVDVIFPPRSPHGSQHGSPQAIRQGNLHRVQRALQFYFTANCRICLLVKATHAFWPCGHRCCCDECGRQLWYDQNFCRCPVCRTEPTEASRRVYDV